MQESQESQRERDAETTGVPAMDVSEDINDSCTATWTHVAAQLEESDALPSSLLQSAGLLETQATDTASSSALQGSLMVSPSSAMELMDGPSGGASSLSLEVVDGLPQGHAPPTSSSTSTAEAMSV